MDDTVSDFAHLLVELLSQDSFLTFLLPFLAILPVVGGTAAFVVSLAGAKRDLAARRAVYDLAMHSAKVTREFEKALKDGRIDDREMKLIVKFLSAELDMGIASGRVDRGAKRFIRDLHPYKSRRVVEELGREVLSGKYPA